MQFQPYVDKRLLRISSPESEQAMSNAESVGEGCHAGQDGDCIWKECPQLRDGEPVKSGRHCPLDKLDEDD